jgi:hypothetical protein
MQFNDLMTFFCCIAAFFIFWRFELPGLQKISFFFDLSESGSISNAVVRMSIFFSLLTSCEVKFLLTSPDIFRM